MIILVHSIVYHEHSYTVKLVNHNSDPESWYLLSN